MRLAACRRKPSRGWELPARRWPSSLLKTQHGDPRYLEVATEGLWRTNGASGASMRPRSSTSGPPRGPFDAMSDEALAEVLAHQRQLLASLDAATDVPSEGDGEVEDD